MPVIPAKIGIKFKLRFPPGLHGLSWQLVNKCCFWQISQATFFFRILSSQL